MSRALARKKDAPPSLDIGLTPSQIEARQYEKDEITRLQEEIQELRDRLASMEYLETFQRLLSIKCPKFYARKITILECAGYRERRQCIKTRCLTRQGLLAKISL